MKWLQKNSDILLLFIVWIVSLSSALAGIAPRFLVALMILYCLSSGLLTLGTGNFERQKIRQFPLLFAALAFAGYVLLSALWTSWPLIAIQKACGFF